MGADELTRTGVFGVSSYSPLLCTGALAGDPPSDVGRQPSDVGMVVLVVGTWAPCLIFSPTTAATANSSRDDRDGRFGGLYPGSRRQIG